jgi:hypothetical protein
VADAMELTWLLNGWEIVAMTTNDGTVGNNRGAKSRHLRLLTTPESVSPVSCEPPCSLPAGHKLELTNGWTRQSNAMERVGLATSRMSERGQKGPPSSPAGASAAPQTADLFTKT